MDREEFLKGLENTEAKSEEEKLRIVNKSIDTAALKVFEADENLIIAIEKLGDIQQHITKHLRENENDLNIIKELDELKEFITSNSEKKIETNRRLVIATEECAELQQCIASFCRNKEDRVNTLEEMADVYIGMYYLKVMLNISDEEVEKAIAVKLDRLEKKILDGNIRV